MNKRSDEFLRKLLSTFKVEAEEHLNALSSGLIELEKASTAEKQMEIIETVFREAHSLKGAARAVNLLDIETICQSLEGIFSALKRKQIALSPALLDLLHSAVDTLSKVLLALGVGPAVVEKPLVAEVVQGLESALRGLPLPPRQAESKTVEAERGIVPGPEVDQPATEGKPASPGTVRISTAKLDSLLLQVEELLSAKQTASERAAELRESSAALAAWKKQWAKIRPDLRAIEQLLERESGRNGQRKQDPQIRKIVEFLEWDNTFAKSLEGKLTALAAWAEHDRRSLGGMVDNLLEDMKRVLMLPFSTLLEIFPKFVRDLARDRGKEVELVIQGGEVEIDRRILEEMKDPLIHLVRNCIDHGVERPKERERKNKPVRGRVTLAIAERNGNKVEILVSDDGAGIDMEKVRAAAFKCGLVSQEEAATLNEQQVPSLIFQSGVSTSPIITDISGRGLGLAIVREKVEKLGGFVSLEARSDIGATFRIVLPLTLATFRGILVRVDEHLFVLPTASVERLVRVNKEEIKTVENRETIQLNGSAVSLVRLTDVLELPRKTATTALAGKVPVVIAGSAEKRIAFQVDEVLDEQEVLVKSLGKQLARVRNVAGATVLGTGKVVPILNVPDLMKSVLKAAPAPARAAVAPEEEEASKRSILVVEDSITARALLKNILETAGYNVKTAVDGVDAFTRLRTEDFDLVVSDVDMPRMNGFDLTAKIRADKKHSDLPVVLVTALESREDRERGIDVGANAYIVKSSFDQSNLLEVMQRLI